MWRQIRWADLLCQPGIYRFRVSIWPVCLLRRDYRQFMPARSHPPGPAGNGPPSDLNRPGAAAQPRKSPSTKTSLSQSSQTTMSPHPGTVSRRSNPTSRSLLTAVITPSSTRPKSIRNSLPTGRSPSAASATPAMGWRTVAGWQAPRTKRKIAADTARNTPNAGCVWPESAAGSGGAYLAAARFR